MREGRLRRSRYWNRSRKERRMKVQVCCPFGSLVRKNLKSDQPSSISLSLLDHVVELNEADEIARRILTKQSVSDDEFRYAVMFNLTAMTQLLWELSDDRGVPSKKEAPAIMVGSYSRSGLGHLKSRAIKLVPVAALVAFLAGVGLGYLIP